MTTDTTKIYEEQLTTHKGLIYSLIRRYFDDEIQIEDAFAYIADKLAERVDFFSVGTNDLVQYALAVDRNNERVAHLYQPSHPAILKLVKTAIDAAVARGIWVSVCGEMAGDPRFVPLLVGMGAHELSMNPSAIAPVRRLIRRLSSRDAADVLEQALKAANADDVLDLVEDMLYEIAPDIMNMIMLGE